MRNHLRRLAVVMAAVVSISGLVVPAPAQAATNLPYPGRLGRWWLADPSTRPGSGTQSMKNSSGQKIGEYELYARYYHGSLYSFELQICVRDTLGNGRGVKARVLLKYGTNYSYEVVKHKDGNCSNTLYPAIGSPVWAVDVDHGEAWSGVDYQYTGYFDRYTVSVSPNQRWPYFEYDEG